MNDKKMTACLVPFPLRKNDMVLTFTLCEPAGLLSSQGM